MAAFRKRNQHRIARDRPQQREYDDADTKQQQDGAQHRARPGSQGGGHRVRKSARTIS
jgi:hypothetical protein